MRESGNKLSTFIAVAAIAAAAACPEVTMFASNRVKRAMGLLPPSTRQRKHYNKPIYNTPEMTSRNAEIEAKRQAKLAARKVKQQLYGKGKK
jgi:hypothetical protein